MFTRHHDITEMIKESHDKLAGAIWDIKTWIREKFADINSKIKEIEKILRTFANEIENLKKISDENAEVKDLLVSCSPQEQHIRKLEIALTDNDKKIEKILKMLEPKDPDREGISPEPIGGVCVKRTPKYILVFNGENLLRISEIGNENTTKDYWVLSKRDEYTHIKGGKMIDILLSLMQEE